MLIVLILRKFLVVARLATLSEHWQPSTLGVLILRKLSLTLLEHWQPSTLGMKKVMM